MFLPALLATLVGPASTPPPAARQAYRAHLAAAQGAMDRGDLRAARAWLEGAPRGSRGWEWRALRAMTEQSQAARKVHAAGGSAMAWSPDGAWLATAAEDGTVTVWDREGSVHASWKAHQGAVTGLDLRGGVLASAGRDKAVRTWRLPGGEALSDFPGHTQGAYGVALSPDGARIASPGWRRGEKGGPIGTFFVWETGRPEVPPRRTDWTTHPLAAAAWSPDGASLAVGGWDHRSRLWNATTLDGAHEFLTEPNAAYRVVDRLAISPDGKLLASACRDRKARLHDLGTGALVAILEGHQEAVSALAFEPGGTRLATGSLDGVLRIFNGPPWRLTDTLRGHGAPIKALAWGPGGMLATLDQAGWLRIWDPASAAGPVLKHGGFAWAFALSPDGKSAALSGSPGLIRIFDTTDGRELRSFEAHKGSTALLAWTPDGSALLSGASPGPPRVWNAATGAHRFDLPGSAAGIPDGAASDGLFVASAYDGSVRAWEAATGRPLGVFTGARNPMGAAILPGQRVASGGGDGVVRLWEAASGREILALSTLDGAVHGLAADPSRTRLAAGSAKGIVRLFDLPRGRHSDLTGHTGAVNALAWSPDGRRLATGAADLSLRIWDAATGEELIALHDFPTAVYRLAWSPDGARLWYLLEGGEARCLDGTASSPRPSATVRTPGAANPAGPR